MAGATKPSLAQDWLSALRYWLRGRNGVIAMIVLTVVIGAALNWSWLVAVGVAPLLLTVLPCAVMCGLGLCMNKMTGSSCSTSSSAADHPDTPMTDVAPRITAVPEPEKRTRLTYGCSRRIAGRFERRCRRAGARRTTAGPEREGVTCAST